MGSILATDDATLDGLIHAVGFHNNKVRYIKAATLLIQQEHGGRVPSTMEGLLALPGVGPKMGAPPASNRATPLGSAPSAATARACACSSTCASARLCACACA